MKRKTGLDVHALQVVGAKDMSLRKDVAAAAGMDKSSAPNWAYVDRSRGWVVQVWERDTPRCDGTPWDGSLRVSVKHTCGRNPKQAMSRDYSIPITWDELQAIKDHLWPEQIAIEIYPPHDQIVDVADLRWLWVLPLGSELPFNLRGAELTLQG